MAQPVARLRANIQADIAQFQANLNRARSDLYRTQAHMKSSVSKMDQDFAQLGKAMSTVTAIGGKMQSSLASIGVGVGLGSIGSEVVDAALRFERLNTQLKFVAGNQAAAAQEMEYLRGVASTMGLEFNATAEAYAKFAAAAKGTALEGRAVREIFEGVAKAATALQLSADDTSGVFLALGQMIGKGTVQAEELRGQLGERLPGAFQIAARAMDVTTGELGKMLESGMVMAEDFLPKFATEMDKTFGAAMIGAAQSTTAQINRAKNAWNELLVTVGTSDTVVTFMQDLTRGAQESGRQITAVAEAFGRVKSAIAEVRLAGSIELMADAQERLAKAQEDFASGSIAQRHLDAVQASYDSIRQSVADLRKELLDLKSAAESIPADPWLKGALERTRDPISGSAVETSAGTSTGTGTAAREAEAVAQRIAQLQWQIAQLGRSEIDQRVAENLKGIKPTPEQAVMIEDLTRKYQALMEVTRASEADIDAAVGMLNEGIANFAQQTEADLDRAVEMLNEGVDAFERGSAAGTEFRDIARDAAGSLFTGFADAVVEAENLNDALGEIVRTLAKLVINKAIGAGLDGLFNWAFPTAATGGPRSGPTIVGERGPELVNLPSGSYVHPASRSGGMMRQVVPQGDIGAPGSIVINAPITINGHGGSREQNLDLAEQMSGQLERLAKRAMREEIGAQQRTGGLLNPRAFGY